MIENMGFLGVFNHELGSSVLGVCHVVSLAYGERGLEIRKELAGYGIATVRFDYSTLLDCRT